MKRALIAVATMFLSTSLFALADLTILNARATPSSIEVGTNFNVTFDLKNSGDAAVSSPKVKVPIPSGTQYVSHGGTLPCSAFSGYLMCQGVAGSSIGPGATMSGLATFKATTVGSMAIQIQADPDATVTETSETNNRASVGGSFFTAPKIATQNTLCPQPRAINQNFGVVFRLSNVGTTGDASVRYSSLRYTVTAPQPFVIVSAVPNINGVSYNTPGTSFTFDHYLGAEDVPLDPGEFDQSSLTLKSSVANTIQIRATVIEERDKSPADNTATCTVTVR